MIRRKRLDFVGAHASETPLSLFVWWYLVAAHVQPGCAVLLPIAALGRPKRLRFYPDINCRRPMWEEYREAWEVLGYRGEGAWRRTK